ncbi:Retrovirus-related Pol polyprotein from transposon TNT 1-94 [Dendrobium catenatum]|uniref:Retrovirus-related Pol polyprotein from transposon TNT 1-94 n=2 Tax=Dendrobium catenatum TaxID=906689 RepID=A0A2I0X387_9ASPA|nr:Retrovirus-related Pol polyprotein from transposon TNT 1-94 [Dendrobium catenatum]
MADQNSATSHRTTSDISEALAEFVIPAPLKFLISNTKNLVSTQLNTDNYAIWRLQLQQHFTANGFGGHLTGITACPPESSKKEHNLWKLIDRNLVSALLSTISSSVLPYVLSLQTAHEVWTTLEQRLQPTNRSRVIQLKNELHNIQKKDRTIHQYLDQIKILVDNIAAAGSKIDAEDVTLYILNGLPTEYNPFKTAIRTSLSPISLDTLYSLLCSEEINLQHERCQEGKAQSDAAAFLSTRNNQGRSTRYRGRNFNSRNLPTTGNLPKADTQNSSRNTSNRPICQICGKSGHEALNCWHRCNLQYAPPSNQRALAVQQQFSSTGDWILDSGASSHLTSDVSTLQNPTPYSGQDSVSIANGNNLPIQNSGQGILPLPDSYRKLKLRNILHVPSLSHNLLSIAKLTSDNNISVSFNANGFEFKDRRDNRTLLRGPQHHGLYHIRIPNKCHTTAFQVSHNARARWHARLGHPHSRLLSSLATQIPELAGSHSFLDDCVSCNVSKCHKLPFLPSSSVCNKPFQLIHSDVWGPAPIASMNGFFYYAIFIDEFTKFTWLYLLTSKNETLAKFKQLHNMIKNKFGSSIQTFRSDGGGEFNSTEFRLYLINNGITHQVSCPHTPEQNGTAERKHRHLLDTTRALLHAAGLPHNLWADAVSTANYLINRLPSPNLLNHTPYYRLHGKEASYDHLRTFGCLCFPWTKPYATNKLSPRSTECIFIGYSSQHKGYRCLHIPSKRIYISRHVKFVENTFPFTLPPANRPKDTPPRTDNPLLLIPTSQLTHSSSQVPIVHSSSQGLSSPIHGASPQHTTTSTNPSSHTSSQPPPVHPMITRLRDGISKPKLIFDLSAVPTINSTPTSYKQASQHEHWRTAMKAEFSALQQNGTWSLVPRPTNKPILGCKWTFKNKLHPNGQIARHKARLVAQGCSQEFGVNYTETFSPVAKMVTIRILLTIAVQNQWPVIQLDVTNAFLHGDLSDEIYMKQPAGFIDSQHPQHVCKLHKSIYGLKQSPRQWFQKFTAFLQSLGFQFSKADPSLLLYNQNSIQIFFLIYVDDILVAGNDNTKIASILQQLHSEFHLKQLGEVSLFLGIQVNKTEQGYFLHQAHYARELLHHAGFLECKPAATPMGTKRKHSVDDQPFQDPSHFRKLAGSLQYLTITRPDIAFATNSICQHMHKPRITDYQDLKRLLRYIKGTVDFGLPLQSGTLQLNAYADADWAADPHDRKSISGHCMFLGTNLISWSVKKQVTVAKSSTEAEYRSLSSATSEILWLRRLLSEFHVPQNAPTTLMCDNTSAIALAHNPMFHARTKHIEIDYHFISGHIKQGAIAIQHVKSVDNIADVLTKPLSLNQFNTLRSKLTIHSQNA